MGCVYMATNTANGKTYIGMTTRDLLARKVEHLNTARKRPHYKFHKALHKYGDEAFTWEVLFTSDNAEQLFSVEQKYIDRYDSVDCGYNQCYGGAGLIPTKELREHKSQSTKELYSNEEYVQHRNNGIKAYWNSPEAKKMAKARAVKTAASPKWRAACKASLTDDVREKMSIRMTKRVNKLRVEDPEYFSRIGKSVSEEGRKSIAQSTKARWASMSEEARSEYIQKMRTGTGTPQWHEALLKGVAKNKKPVKCVETNVVYPSVKEAAFACSTTNQNINAVLHGKQHTTRGLTFIYHTEEVTECA